MRRNIRTILIIALPVIAVLALLWGYNNIHIYSKTAHIPADCNNSGKDAKICAICGKMVFTDAEPPTEHIFGVWHEYEASTAATNGKEIRTCTICGKFETRVVSSTSMLPRLYFTGSAIGLSSTNSIVAQFGNNPDSMYSASFLMMDDNEEGKYSYIIDVIADPNGGESTDIELGYFGKNNKVLLYAHNDEPSHSHAIIHTELWGEILSTYPELADFEICSVTDDTTIAGNHIMLYIRNKFAGIYTLTLPAENMFEKNHNLPDGTVVVKPLKDDVQIIYAKNTDSSQATDSFYRFVDACAQDFEIGAARYSDSNLLADYYNFCRMTAFSTGLSRDVYWITTDGVKWYPIPVSNEGESFGTKYGTPELAPSNDNLLFAESGYFTDAIWTSLMQGSPELVAQSFYKLSGGIMSTEKVSAGFAEKMQLLDPELFVEEFRTYKKRYSEEYFIPSNVSKWYTERVSALAEVG